LVEAQRLCREAEGEPLAIEVVVKDIERKIEAADGVVDYVHVVDADTVARRTDVVAVGSSLIAVAAFFGSVRLIDNIEV